MFPRILFPCVVLSQRWSKEKSGWFGKQKWSWSYYSLNVILVKSSEKHNDLPKDVSLSLIFLMLRDRCRYNSGVGLFSSPLLCIHYFQTANSTSRQELLIISRHTNSILPQMFPPVLLYSSILAAAHVLLHKFRQANVSTQARASQGLVRASVLHLLPQLHSLIPIIDPYCTVHRLFCFL